MDEQRPLRDEFKMELLALVSRTGATYSGVATASGWSDEQAASVEQELERIATKLEPLLVKVREHDRAERLQAIAFDEYKRSRGGHPRALALSESHESRAADLKSEIERESTDHAEDILTVGFWLALRLANGRA